MKTVLIVVAVLAVVAALIFFVPFTALYLGGGQ